MRYRNIFAAAMCGLLLACQPPQEATAPETPAADPAAPAEGETAAEVAALPPTPTHWTSDGNIGNGGGPVTEADLLAGAADPDHPDVGEAGRGAVFDAHEALPLAPAQVEIAVAPGMQLRRSPQRLAGPGGGALAGMVHEHDGGVEAALEVAQEAEDGGDVGDGVLVDAVQAHQGVEDEQSGLDALDGLMQALAVAFEVEAQDRDIDDGDVEGLEPGAGGASDALEAVAHDVPGVLGGEQHHGAASVGAEVAQAWHG